MPDHHFATPPPKNPRTSLADKLSDGIDSRFSAFRLAKYGQSASKNFLDKVVLVVYVGSVMVRESINGPVTFSSWKL